MKKTTTLTVLFLLAVLVATVGSAAAAESKTVFRAPLSGVETGSDAHGNAVFRFSDDGTEMSYKLVVNGLDNTTMAHIHVSDTPCVANPPTLWLYPDGPPPQLSPGTFNGMLGERTVTDQDLDLNALREAIEMGHAYVLVHSAQFPAGEICGVIR